MPRVLHRLSLLASPVAASILIAVSLTLPTDALGLSRASSADPQVFLTTSTLSRKLAHVADLRFSSRRPRGALVPVNDNLRYQRIAGIGAALTDSSAWLIHDELPAAARSAVMEDLFGVSGIHMSFLRVPMGASDFTAGERPYSYDEMPAGQSDPTLAHFSIAHDQPYVLPLLREAFSLNSRMQILASPWTAPSWMKANSALDDLGAKGSLLPSDYGPFAQYIVKFIQAYAAAGVRVVAVTPENEPSVGYRSIPFPGMTLTAQAESTLVSQYLAPALHAAGLYPRIYGADNSWDELFWGLGLLNGPAAPYLAGLARHCYFGSPTYMSQFHKEFPAFDEIVDECSPEIRPLSTPEYLIASLRNWASMVSLWNIALDPRGGPVEQPNLGCPHCSGMLTIDERTHTVSFSKRYYQVGQISKFVQSGAVRINSPSSVTYSVTPRNFAIASPGLDDVAFLNPNGSKVLIAYNNTGRRLTAVIRSDGRYFSYTVPGWAMVTFFWDRGL